MQSRYDVVIAGGGLAGLTLARQLHLRAPELAVLVLDKQADPLPVAAHKVGESSVEGGTHYLCNVLQLDDYVRTVHLPKLGLRFFGGGGSKEFDERFELGAIDFPPVHSAQFDRGVLENDLRRMLRDDGIEVRGGAAIREIDLRGAGPHAVSWTEAGSEHSVLGNWVVDATGRRRLIQSKLRLGRPSPHRASATWWRVEGEINLDGIVDASHPDWSARTRQKRWFSTNHMVGKGYWVWVIPLCSGNTSIGIVAQEDLHPVNERASFATSIEWLERHEPALLRFLGERKLLDFLVLKHYAHMTAQAFSVDRWACVGEAAAFVDPLYSTGTDLIAWANSFVTEMVLADRRGELTAERVALYNRGFIQIVAQLTEWFRDSFAVFQSDKVALSKLLWDALQYFSFPGRAMIQGVAERPADLERFLDKFARMGELDRRVQVLFRDWAAETDDNKLPAGMYHPFIRCPHVRGNTLNANDRIVQESAAMFAEVDQRMAVFEELAQVMFWRAARDVRASSLPDPTALRWIDPLAISLDPAAWDREGLFRPTTPARDLGTLFDEIVGLCRPVDPHTEMPASTQQIRERV